MSSEPAAPHLAIAALYFLPTLVWIVLAYNHLIVIRRKRLPPMRVFWILPVFSALVGLFYVVLTLAALIQPPEGRFWHLLLVGLGVLPLVLLGPVLRHFITALPSWHFTELRPSRTWLGVNYGSAVVVGALALLVLVSRPPSSAPWNVSVNLATAYLLLMLGLVSWRVRRSARPGPLRLGTLRGQLQYSDFVIIGACWVLLVGLLVGGLITGGDLGVATHVGIASVGLLGGTSFALRGLDMVLRQLLMAVSALAAAGTVYFGMHAVASSLASPVGRLLLDLGGVLGLVLLLVPGRSWMQGVIDRVLLRHSRRCREELQTTLHALSPEMGPIECCRRAVGEIARVMQLPGAAILLARDGAVVASGSAALEPLRRVWPTGTAADDLPLRAFDPAWVREVSLKQALADADIVAVVPIISPRQRWGHLFISSGLFGTATREEHVATLEGFADQLALLLDAADLLARAVAVERSLAHAEKLAAIGELVARIVHDIRNPVTAARSLAQQLAREPGSPFTAEHTVILTELDRVERQVADLLRFARREEYRLEPVDLGGLVRSTVEQFRPRFEAGGVRVELELPDHVTARADRERIRQVMINLIENAVDALADGTSVPRLGLTVRAVNGSATLSVSDNGPGVPADALPHLFEPFFSLKANGTGLGLAIARRTVEGHSGRIAARTCPTGSGMIFEIALPLAASTGEDVADG